MKTINFLIGEFYHTLRIEQVVLRILVDTVSLLTLFYFSLKIHVLSLTGKIVIPKAVIAIILRSYFLVNSPLSLPENWP